MNFLTVAVIGILLGAGAAADRFTPVIGANARIHHFKAERDAWREKAQAWIAYGRAEKKAYEDSERNRGIEFDRGVAALNEAAEDCAQRVARARRSAVAIRGIITREPRQDANHCPVRELVPAGELRDAIAPEDRG